MKLTASPQKICLLLLAFLAPIIGGHVPTEPQPMFGGILAEIFGGGSLPLTSRLLLIALVAVGLFFSLYRQPIVQAPHPRILAAVGFLLLALGVSVIVSPFKYFSARDFVGWLALVGVLVLTVSSLGRGKDYQSALTALVAGCGVVGFRGLLEYLGRVSEDPSHRIFAGWNNPNAVASILIVGLLVGAGSVVAFSDYRRWIAGAATLFSGSALWLTGSKGGLLAAIVGMVCLAAFVVAFRGGMKKAAMAVGTPLLGIVLGFGLFTAMQSSGTASRIVAGAGQAEQSVGFRQNLWKTSVQLALDHPMGTGLGTFRQYSAEPGLVEPTVYAHQAFLQWWAEAGFLGIVALLLLITVWAYTAFKGARRQQGDQAMAKATVFAAILGIGAHGMVESNLSFFGLAVSVFILLGVGLQLSTEGSTPERLPRSLTGFILLLCGLVPTLAMTMFAASELQKTTYAAAIAGNDPERLPAALQAMAANSYGDPEAEYFVALRAPTDEERYSGLTAVAQKLPTPRVFRTLAQAALQRESTKFNAGGYLEQALKLEPNSLSTHWMLVETADQLGDSDKAVAYARKLVDLESTTSYQVRAIPELVPTQTFEARLYLADRANSEEEAYAFRKEAVEGFLRYATTTVPRVKDMAEGGFDFAGESLADAERKLGLALDAARQMQDSPQAQSSADSSWLTETIAALESALAG